MAQLVKLWKRANYKKNGFRYFLDFKDLDGKRHRFSLGHGNKRKAEKQRAEKDQLRDWLDRTIDFEVFPALEVRINRFLAEAYLKLKKFDEALSRLDRIVEIADTESEHSLWARMSRLKIKK